MRCRARKVARSIREGAHDLARDLSESDTYVTSRRERKKIEMLFAHLRGILWLDRLRLRGPNGARDEVLLVATAQYLRKLAKLRPMPVRQSPLRLREASRRSPPKLSPHTPDALFQRNPVIYVVPCRSGRSRIWSFILVGKRADRTSTTGTKASFRHPCLNGGYRQIRPLTNSPFIPPRIGGSGGVVRTAFDEIQS